MATTEIISEFRTALEEEIEAARRTAAASATQLTNGRRLAQVGGSYQYVFGMESGLQAPDGSPADLHLPGRERTEATIVSVEGLKVTLSVSEDLGQFVPRARLQSDLTQLLRKLIERIDGRSDTASLTSQYLLGLATPAGTPASVWPLGLNEQQRRAVGSSIGRDATFIWGPPGTGKTKVIGEIGAELYRRGQSVLVVSHTNTAVDGAILEIAAAIGADDIEDGSVLRVGDPRDIRLQERSELLASTEIERRTEELAERRRVLQAQKKERVDQGDQLRRRIEICEWQAGAEVELSAMQASLEDLHRSEASVRATMEDAEALRTDLPSWEASEVLALTMIPEVRSEKQLVKDELGCKGMLENTTARLSEASRAVADAHDLYERTRSTNLLFRRLRRLPRPDEQLAVTRQLEAERHAAEQDEEALRGQLEKIQVALRSTRSNLAEFRARFAVEPKEIISQAQAHKKRARATGERASELESKAQEEREQLAATLEERLATLREWGLTRVANGSAETMLSALEQAYAEASRGVQGEQVEALRQRLQSVTQEVRDLDRELGLIEEMLNRVEELVVGEAMVVATTLTRAYLRDSVQGRRFDTVILDEASMAPIPALWVVATLGESVVVVGDFEQLPPIKQSIHPLAEKWLGRDVFFASGVEEAHRRGEPPEWFVPLREQHRMHPAISAIPNKLVYEGKLSDHEDTLSDKELDGWFDLEWGYDAPVLFLDTGSLNAWVTSVNSSGRSSRLNFMSAAVAVALAQRLLKPGRPPVRDGERPRIIVSTPYRPQARLLQMMIREQALDREVAAGTTHQFQGNEASVVIFDFVNDEPHWRVRMFDASKDGDTKRLLNVALTRARRRLILIGDYRWMIRNTKPHAFLRRLLEFVREKGTLVDVRDVIIHGLAAQAAAVQDQIQGGADSPLQRRVVVTQDAFYPLLARDLSEATKRIVVYSPFMTANRISWLQPQLRAAVERGVHVYVVTKAREERTKREAPEYSRLEEALTGWRVTVIHKLHMHEKLVFIDDDLLWSGSLNPLSFSNTQEVMERRQSSDVVGDYSSTLRLEDLLGAHDAGQTSCPVCGQELIAAEGREDPFYWRCVEKGCHTRSIDQPAPKDGRIVCANCGGGLRYGEWGGSPYWRCAENLRHRQRIVRNHLLLPKMRELVPSRELRELDRRLSRPQGKRGALQPSQAR